MYLICPLEKSAASAAPPRKDLEAVLESADTTASPTAWGAPRPRRPHPSRRPGAPQAVGSAELAADLITDSKSLRGGCASSQLDHGSLRIRLKNIKKTYLNPL